MDNRRRSSVYSRTSRGRRRVGARSLSRRSTRGFIRRNAKILAIAAVVLAVAVICLVLFTGGGGKGVVAQSSQQPGQSAATSTPVPTIDLSEFSGEYNYEGVDESILAGLAGTDESLFTDEGDEMFVTSGIKIGITIGGIGSDNDKLLLEKLEEATGDAVKKGLVYEVYCYDAEGDYNQQLQDMRSLVKNEVDVIIVGATDEESFQMVSFMAEQEGIPLVAYDAPAQTGYAVNIISNQTTWGERYGEFVAKNLDMGSVLQVLGSETSAIDKERKAAIDGKLKAKSALSVSASYASGSKDKANQAIDALFAQDAAIDGVITGEGMAEGVLDAFIEAGKLPKVMCGDTTAGFIKKWYALKNGGVVIVPPTQGKKSPPPAEVFAAQPGEFIVCAQPAPARASVIAFDAALKLAEGRTLITQGVDYRYSTATFITEDNLSYYYEMVKSMPDTYAISDPIDTAAAESLFNPAE